MNTPHFEITGNQGFAAIHQVGFTNPAVGLTFTAAEVWGCLSCHFWTTVLLHCSSHHQSSTCFLVLRWQHFHILQSSARKECLPPCLLIVLHKSTSCTQYNEPESFLPWKAISSLQSKHAGWMSYCTLITWPFTAVFLLVSLWSSYPAGIICEIQISFLACAAAFQYPKKKMEWDRIQFL